MERPARAVVCLLRGVNVGGRGMVRMETLRAVCSVLGLDGARTYRQSGNLVFRTEREDHPSLAAEIEQELRAAGVEAAALLRSSAELRRVVAANPFKAFARRDPSKLIVYFLAAVPGEGERTALQAASRGAEELGFAGRQLFVAYPEGVGRSRLTGTIIESRLRVAATGRNWRTVTALLQLAEEVEAEVRA